VTANPVDNTGVHDNTVDNTGVHEDNPVDNTGVNANPVDKTGLEELHTDIEAFVHKLESELDNEIDDCLVSGNDGSRSEGRRETVECDTKMRGASKSGLCFVEFARVSILGRGKAHVSCKQDSTNNPHQALNSLW
jgi:hypothetical protein